MPPFYRAPWRWRESFPQFPPGFSAPVFHHCAGAHCTRPPALPFHLSPKYMEPWPAALRFPCSLVFHYAGQCRSVCPERLRHAHFCRFVGQASERSGSLACSGRQPGWQRAGILFNQDADKAVRQPHDGPVYHYRPVFPGHRCLY